MVFQQKRQNILFYDNNGFKSQVAVVSEWKMLPDMPLLAKIKSNTCIYFK